jgi:2,3-bisphosphoglycerate-dependent phosphoglycerate mutase
MDLSALESQYGKDKVSEALEILTYKKADPLPKEESDTSPVLYVFRHGQSQDNADFLFSGWRDSPLTDKGREQALELAEKLKDKKIDMLISSPQLRAVETMQIGLSLNKNAKDMDIAKDERLKERCYGDLQGQSKLELHLKDPQLLENYRRSYTDAPPGGESLEQVCKRVEDFCNEIVPLMKQFKLNVAVSCHGNSIRGFRKYFENMTPEEVKSVETPLAKDYASYVIK